MKTTFLTAAVLIALGMGQYADAYEYDDAAKAEEAAKREAEASVSKPTAAPTPPASAPPAAPAKAPIIVNDIVKDGVTGQVRVSALGDDRTEISFTCAAGNCDKKTVVLNKRFKENTDHIQDIVDFVRPKAETVARRNEDKETPAQIAKRERDEAKDLAKARETARKDKENEVSNELKEELETACSVTEGEEDSGDEDVFSSSASVRSNPTQLANLELSRTRFAGIQAPQRNSKAECSVRVLRSFMNSNKTTEKEQRALKQDLKNLRSELRDLETDLKTAKTDTEKNRIKNDIKAKKVEISEAQIAVDAAGSTERATSKIARTMVINPAVSHIAARDPRMPMTQSDFLLHDLAASAPGSFNGVRKLAANGLLDIYRLQSQTALAYNESASRETNPAKKLALQQAAQAYYTSATAFNTVTMQANGRIAGQAMSAGLNPQSIMEEIYSVYRPGAQEITSYLGRISVNGALKADASKTALPSVLYVKNEDGSFTAVANPAGTLGTDGRNGRVKPAAAGNGTPGQQLSRPVPVAPSAQNITIGGPQNNGVQPLVRRRQ